MNVNDGLHGLPDLLGVSQASNVQPVEHKPSAAGTGGSALQDSTEVSTAAGMAHRAMSLSDVRMDKVAAVQQALANGTFQVSSGDVADKLIRQMVAA